MRRIGLLVYNLLFFPIVLILLPGYLLRIRKRGGYGAKWRQRFGVIDRKTLSRIGLGRVWIHAVSVGETGIALKFAAEYRQRNPDARFLISSTTSTGLAILEKHASDWLEPMANPVDFPFVTGRLLRRFSPSAVIMIEADLWPNRVAASKELGIPVILLNARLSSRSENRYRRFRTITAPLFNQLDLITLTDESDPARWHSMGVGERILRLTGNIKHDASAHPSPVERGDVTPPVFLAASTHRGEEKTAAEAWLAAKREFPSLRLVIAPRHAERREEIRDMLGTLGIRCTLRSEGADLSETPLLLDTTGELYSWYPKASVVLVGKSLPTSVNRGGQNMIEPLQAGAPVLMGPHTSNFEPLADRLFRAGAAERVNDSDEIARALRRLLEDPARGKTMILIAADVLAPHRGAVHRSCELVEGLLKRESI